MRWTWVLLLAACSGSKSTPTADKPPATDKPPAPTDHVDSSTYEKACATADDCVIVDEWKCNKCGCSDKVIAKKELDRFRAALEATSCTPDDRRCGDCRGFKAACEGSKCVTHPE